MVDFSVDSVFSKMCTLVKQVNVAFCLRKERTRFLSVHFSGLSFATISFSQKHNVTEGGD